MNKEQKEFEDMLHQISMTADTYLAMALNISNKLKELMDSDNSSGKMEILNNQYYQVLRTTAKAYTDEAMCCLATLFSDDPNEISIKKYDNKFNKNLTERFSEQHDIFDQLKIKSYRDWFVAHKDKRKTKNPYLNDLFGYKIDYIKDLYALSQDMYKIMAKELITPCNNYFLDKMDKGLDDLVIYCISRIKK